MKNYVPSKLTRKEHLIQTPLVISRCNVIKNKTTKNKKKKTNKKTNNNEEKRLQYLLTIFSMLSAL